jgi:hypothetical protein
VAVRARSAWNSGAREAVGMQAFAMLPKVSSVSVAADKASPQRPSTTITWTAAAAGGQAPYQYQWAIFDGAVWTTVRDWSTSSTFSWTPATANGAYVVAVRARSAWNSGTRELATTVAFAIQ